MAYPTLKFNNKNNPDYISGECPHSTIGGSTADYYFFIDILLTFSVLSFGFLLFPVGQWDTDYGCKNGTI